MNKILDNLLILLHEASVSDQRVNDRKMADQLTEDLINLITQTFPAIM